MRTAIATSIYLERPDNMGILCALPKWCMNADILSKRFTIDVVVWTNRAKEVRTECPRARILSYDSELEHTILNFTKHVQIPFSRSLAGPRFTLYNLLKWQLVNPVHGYSSVLYMDTDVDISIFSMESETSTWHYYFRTFLPQFEASHFQLMATPDHESPINGGIMVIKPSSEYYEEGMRAIRSHKFNATHGWEWVGPPKQFVPKPKHLSTNAMFRKNTWDFVGGNADQGLFTYIFMIRHNSYSPTYDGMHVRHFWANTKPWVVLRCKAYFNFLKYVYHETPCIRYLRNIRAKKHCKGGFRPIF